MPNAAIWLERYRRRYHWAVSAYNRFVRDLAPELVDTLQRNEQVTVVVYGATQVGKTTLILDLLGLGTLTTDEVGSVLRGGQQLGKSATAMPIRYGRSKDDSWYIAGEEPLSADAARERLGGFRRKVESGDICDSEVLDIRIPRRLFPQREESSPGLELNIIDIPGINSRNEDERQLVAQLARRYVTVADLVLLVGRADSLGFLNEEDLQVEALADWSVQPTRFRIVLTFSFSPDSLYRQFMNRDLTIERVRDVLIAEMSTHDYDFPPAFRSNLFVLELGDSVTALERTNPDYCQRIIEVTKDFREELLGNIELAAGPYARLHGAFQLDRVINARVERLHQVLVQQDAELDVPRAQVIRELATFCPDLLDAQEEAIFSALEALQREQAELDQRQDELLACMNKLDDFNCVWFFSTELSSGASEKVSWLQSELQRCEAEQRKACSWVAQRLVDKGIVPEWCADDVPTIDYRRTHLMEIESRLDGYVVDDYWWSSSNFNEDRDSLLRALRLAAKDHGQRLKSGAQHALQERKQSLRLACDGLQSQCYVLQSYLDRLHALEREREDMYAEHAYELQKMEDSQRMASRFESQLNSAFLSELRKTRAEAKNHPNPAQRFYGLLHTRLLLSEIDRMYEGRGF